MRGCQESQLNNRLMNSDIYDSPSRGMAMLEFRKFLVVCSSLAPFDRRARTTTATGTSAGEDILTFEFSLS